MPLRTRCVLCALMHKETECESGPTACLVVLVAGVSLTSLALVKRRLVPWASDASSRQRNHVVWFSPFNWAKLGSPGVRYHVQLWLRPGTKKCRCKLTSGIFHNCSLMLSGNGKLLIPKQWSMGYQRFKCKWTWKQRKTCTEIHTGKFK